MTNAVRAPIGPVRTHLFDLWVEQNRSTHLEIKNIPAAHRNLCVRPSWCGSIECRGKHFDIRYWWCRWRKILRLSDHHPRVGYCGSMEKSAKLRNVEYRGNCPNDCKHTDCGDKPLA